VTDSALSDRDLSVPARLVSPGRPVIGLRRGGQALAGSYLYEGDGLITGWHSHEVHQIEYALPVGLEHQAVMNPDVKTVAVMFDPALIPDAGGRARIIAVSPLIREMMVYALRWPIHRSPGSAQDERESDNFFRTLAALVSQALDHEAPLSLPTSDHPIVATALAYTKEHLDAVSADEVARAVAVSERTMRRLFADTIGMPWRTYLLHARMLRAMALLAAPGQSVQATSSAVGFESLSSFTRCFAQFCGETPSAYRRRVSGPAN